MAKMLARCPVCEGALKISELSCGSCNTRIQSSFDPCRFCNLPAEHLSFLEAFLRSEGNLSKVEKEMGLSYPTVRNRLTAALQALGLSAETQTSETTRHAAPSAETHSDEETAERRRLALNALARGEMAADDVARVLRELS